MMLEQPNQAKINNRGFSLIEVLIAVGIFSIGLLGIGTLLIASTNGNATARRVTESSSWAADRIEQLLIVPYDDLASSAEDETEGSYSISWVVTDDTPVDNVKSIDVTIRNPRNHPENITFTYYKAREY